MDIINCKNCGKLILKRNSTYCDICSKELSEYIRKIKNYISKNPNSNIIDLHNNTGIPLKTINDLIKDRIIDIV